MHGYGWPGLGWFYKNTPPLSSNYSWWICSWSIFQSNLPRLVAISNILFIAKKNIIEINHRPAMNRFSGTHHPVKQTHSKLSSLEHNFFPLNPFQVSFAFGCIHPESRSNKKTNPRISFSKSIPFVLSLKLTYMFSKQRTMGVICMGFS